MSNPTWLTVEIEPYLRDCPPNDKEIPEELIREIAEEVFSAFDFTDVYDQLDELILSALRARGIEE